MERQGISFFAMNCILLFLVISFILIVFDLHRFAFVIELGILLILISFMAFGMFLAYHDKKFGWTMLGASIILLLINTFFIFLITDIFETPHMTIIFFSVIGLLVVLLNLRHGIEESYHAQSEEDYKPNGYYQYIDKMESVEQPKDEPKIAKTFTPGKFIASKKANKFHVAKCDWASRISKSNQIWFNSKEDAEAQGFEADKCVG
ncbi:MAG: hypothetical protein AABX33_03130 [Nanoarchaeota archaeon]